MCGGMLWCSVVWEVWWGGVMWGGGWGGLVCGCVVGWGGM